MNDEMFLMIILFLQPEKSTYTLSGPWEKFLDPSYDRL